MLTNKLNFLPAEYFEISGLIKLASTTNVQVAMGVTINTAANDDGIYFWKATADTNWFGQAKSGGTATKTDTGVAVGTAWTAFRVRRVDAATVGFALATTLTGLYVAPETLVTTNIPTAAVEFFVALFTAEAVAKSISVDYLETRFSKLVR